jgi:hypothetical protein
VQVPVAGCVIETSGADKLAIFIFNWKLESALNADAGTFPAAAAARLLAQLYPAAAAAATWRVPMRRALAALGGGGGGGEEDSEREPGAKEVEAGRGSQPAASCSSHDAGLVDALDAAELRREVQLWHRMCYKSTSQHRRAVHFQRMRGVTRYLRALSALNVGAAAAALRDALSNGVSEEARALALSSPAVAAGAHALWKLPPRALWEDLARRLRAAVARLRAGLHQMVVDVVAGPHASFPFQLQNLTSFLSFRNHSSSHRHPIPCDTWKMLQ